MDRQKNPLLPINLNLFEEWGGWSDMGEVRGGEKVKQLLVEAFK